MAGIQQVTQQCPAVLCCSACMHVCLHAGALCLFAYLYMRPFVRRGLGSAGRCADWGSLSRCAAVIALLWGNCYGGGWGWGVGGECLADKGGSDRGQLLESTFSGRPHCVERSL
jgi:hypothetical protein